MPNQEQSRDGKPRKDGDRPSPDVGRASGATSRGDQSSERSGERPMAGNAADRGEARTGDPKRPDYRGDGPAKVGLTSDAQPDLVAPSGVNERDHGAADDKPMGGGALDFDDGDMAHPRGRTTGAGRTWDEKTPSDAGRLGPPNVGMSNHNGPSDPDAKRNR